MDFDYCVVYCTCPSEPIAENLAKTLLGQSLVACINIIPAVSSHYMWEGATTSETEVMLVMKTKKEKLHDLELKIVAEHPYECPEIIAMPIVFGNTAYLKWIDDCTA